ncbi:MAG: undecaprenyl-diphosphate phosphatase [Chloroflexi bacterium]|nr:undecaprenyl-diphosphate phosphatase [Chloroflexota bacterium]MCY3582595.1 undecaprenyl-diphosphate phosphatase [Chloroflexota bacterium]MCY3715277.1 undecaprenyl-diphosphate phosphatase [Chloroflexota bacterium]MDE2652122.1 undecaprenyl-diphosphate phosphatase [Chloroflexota bacterium]MXX51664.1 undecaprenyl-diphosphate phosphatase [Chloroflexota bacterium]
MGEDLLRVAALALVEGLTEFLPISSTGHLIVGKALLRFDALGTVFEIVIQFGAACALLLYYRKSLLAQVAQFPSNAEVRRFWLLILVACLPAAALGLLLEAQIEANLFSPQVVALALIAGGIVLLLVERYLRGRTLHDARALQINELTLRQALIVGAAQAFALIPGVSRSGSSIVGGLLTGLNRRAATEFSFYLALPLLGGTTVYKLVKSLPELSGDALLLLAVGTALAGFFAWMAIDWLLGYVSRHSFALFGVYRIVAGGLIWLAAAGGVIA